MIVVTIRCYVEDDPWAERPGFDMQGTCATSYTTVEGSQERPKMPSTFMINDYVTGYLGPAVALIRWAKEGGSYQVKVSLALPHIMLFNKLVRVM